MVSVVPREHATIGIKCNPQVCIGCGTCELLCSLFHETEFSPALARIYVYKDPIEGTYVPELCKHCLSPKCFYECPVEGAMVIDGATGAVIIVDERCNGCGRCAEACPFNAEGRVVRFNSQKKVYYKCDLCGGEPQCVKWCSSGSLTIIK